MDEDLDLEKCAIEELPVVSSVCFHAGDKTHKAGYHDNLRCGCGVKEVGPIRMSSKFPTLRHHARQGTHDDRKNNVAHSSGLTLASHVLQKGVAHGPRKYTD
jgi:hypothetical protein